MTEMEKALLRLAVRALLRKTAAEHPMELRHAARAIRGPVFEVAILPEMPEQADPGFPVEQQAYRATFSVEAHQGPSRPVLSVNAGMHVPSLGWVADGWEFEL